MEPNLINFGSALLMTYQQHEYSRTYSRQVSRFAVKSLYKNILIWRFYCTTQYCVADPGASTDQHPASEVHLAILGDPPDASNLAGCFRQWCGLRVTLGVRIGQHGRAQARLSFPFLSFPCLSFAISGLSCFWSWTALILWLTMTGQRKQCSSTDRNWALP